MSDRRSSNVLSEIDKILPLHDHREYDPDPCKCDLDVNYHCEMCITHSVLSEAKREIERLTAERDRLLEANLKICKTDARVINNLIETIRTLTAERDEAREVLRQLESIPLPINIAMARIAALGEGDDAK